MTVMTVNMYIHVNFSLHRTDSEKITDIMSLENVTVVEQISVADLYHGVQHEIVIQAQKEKKGSLTDCW